MSQIRLAALMFTDNVDYNPQKGRDQRKAFTLLRKNRYSQQKLIKKYRGELLKEIGEGILENVLSIRETIVEISDPLYTEMQLVHLNLREDKYFHLAKLTDAVKMDNEIAKEE